MFSRLKVVASLLLVTGFCVSAIHAAEGEKSGSGTKIGGMAKLGLFDYSSGTSNDTASSSSTGFDIKEVVLMISQEITDYLSIDIEPVLSASTGATPKLGVKVGGQVKAPSARTPGFGGWDRFLVKGTLPHDIEISAGIVKPRFTLDYGAEMFWDDQLHGSKFTCNTLLGAMHETGIEGYKNFELGKVSLPVYLYVLNGNEELISDDNKTPVGMIHVEPEIGPFKFTGSFYGGKWDPDSKLTVERWSLGGVYTWQGLSVRSEYAGGLWQKKPTAAKDTLDLKPQGFNVHATYKLASWLKVGAEYSVVDNNFSGNSFTSPTSAIPENYTTLSPVVTFIPVTSTNIFIQEEIANWSNQTKTNQLKYNRSVVGVRSVF